MPLTASWNSAAGSTAKSYTASRAGLTIYDRAIVSRASCIRLSGTLSYLLRRIGATISLVAAICHLAHNALPLYWRHCGEVSDAITELPATSVVVLAQI